MDKTPREVASECAGSHQGNGGRNAELKSFDELSPAQKLVALETAVRSETGIDQGDPSDSFYATLAELDKLRASLGNQADDSEDQAHADRLKKKALCTGGQLPN